MKRLETFLTKKTITHIQHSFMRFSSIIPNSKNTFYLTFLSFDTHFVMTAFASATMGVAPEVKLKKKRVQKGKNYYTACVWLKVVD